MNYTLDVKIAWNPLEPGNSAITISFVRIRHDVSLSGYILRKWRGATKASQRDIFMGDAFTVGLDENDPSGILQKISINLIFAFKNISKFFSKNLD